MMFSSYLRSEAAEGVRPPLTLSLPFLGRSVGSGDLVKGLTDALRIPQCGGCRERQDWLNRRLQFRPARSLWED